MRASAPDNPRLIHCSILAFGRGGRYYNRPAYDPIVQSLSGVAGTLARATGEPRFVPMVMSDHTSGLIAAQCIGFALYRREKTGTGEAIDVPMLENMASFVSSEHLGAMTFDPPVGPSGDDPACSAPTTGRCRPRTATSRSRPNTNRAGLRLLRRHRPARAQDRSALRQRRARAPPTPPPTSRCARRAWRRRRRRSGWRSSTSSTCRRRATTRSTIC